MGTMAAYGSTGLRPLRRSSVGMALALVALFLHVAMPLAFQLAPASAQGLFETIICTSDGARTVLIDAEGNPVDPAPGQSSQHECKSCVHHCGAALLSHITMVAPGWGIATASLVAVKAASLVYAVGSYPRAPPA